MANDYWGYIATYREYQRGDHYRKALTGLGEHASDWLATRLVAMGGALKGDPTSIQKIQYGPLDEAYMIDGTNQEARAELLGHDAQVYLTAYDRLLPPAGGTPGRAVSQPSDVNRFDVAEFTWDGGSNYTDDPVVTVQRLENGAWVTAGDQSGDVVVTAQLPDPSGLVTYATGSYEWKWTAHFEAFDSDIDTGRGTQTRAGAYRFHVDGLHRHGLPPSAQPYATDSSPFQVKPWEGITVPDIRVEPDGTVSFTVGPQRTKPFFTSYPANPMTPTTSLSVGPIDYPDAWPRPKLDAEAAVHTGDKVFPREERTVIGGQRYCFSCTFRPWADTGQVASASVELLGAGGRTVPATLGPNGRWHTKATLQPGQSARIGSGGIRDTFGERNGTASATVSRTA